MRSIRQFFIKHGRALFEAALCIALVACIVLYAQSRLFPPAREELLAVSGQCRVPESRTVYDLYVENSGEVSGPYKLDDRIVPNAGQIIRDIEQGAQAELLYIDDEDCTVMELTVNGEELLSYDRALAMWYQEIPWTSGTALLTVVVVVVMLGGVAAAVCWKNRRRAAQERRETEERRAAAEESRRRLRRQLAKVHYSDEELHALEGYVEESFGRVVRTYYEFDPDIPKVDLIVCAPSKGRALYTVTTFGLGAFRLSVPKELEERNQSFAELSVLLPESWDLAEDTWPLALLKELSHAVIESYEEADTPLPGRFFRCGESVREESGFYGVLTVPASVREGLHPRVMLPYGRMVNFYLLVPIYEAEWNYIIMRGSSLRLWKRMAARGLGAFVQPGRECCVDPETWFDEDIAPFCFGENAARGEYHLGLGDLTYCVDSFAACGLAPSGGAWERVVRLFLREEGERAAEGDIDLACDEEGQPLKISATDEMLFIESGNETWLRRFALRLRDLCEDETALMELIERSKEKKNGT